MKRAICLAIVVVATGNVAFAGLSDGLVAYYPFNGNANDESGNGNDGVLMGNASVVGGILSLDGDADYVQVADSGSLDLTTAGTLSARVKLLPGTNIEHRTIFGKMTGSSGGQVSYELAFRNIGMPSGPPVPGLVGAAHDGVNNLSAYHYPEDIRNDTWHHVAFTWSPSTPVVYLDGQPANDQTDTTGTGAMVSSFDVWIGKFSYVGQPYYLQGWIDDVRIYNRALSGDEIRTLATIPAPGAVVLAGLGVSVVGWLRRRRYV